MLIHVHLKMMTHATCGQGTTHTVPSSVFEGHATLDFRTYQPAFRIPTETRKTKLAPILRAAFVDRNSSFLGTLRGLSMGSDDMIFYKDLANVELDVPTVLNGGTVNHVFKQRGKSSDPSGPKTYTRTVTSVVTFEKAHIPHVLI